MRRQTDLAHYFAQHRVAANLFMAIMILAGCWALAKLNTQFFPTLPEQIITVRVAWSGASPEDVESGITIPLEQELRNLDHLDKFSSSSLDGVASITLEFEEGTDMQMALERTTSAVRLVRNLPADAEQPEIARLVRYEAVARVVLTTEGSIDELRPLAQRLKNDLLARGISKIDVVGLPDEEIAIQVPAARLQEVGLTLEQFAAQIQEQSRDLPAGSIGREDLSRQLRGLDQQRSVPGFEALPLYLERGQEVVPIGDLARVERRARDGAVTLEYFGKPAVELRLRRAESADSLHSAQILERWLHDVQPTLPASVQIHVYDQAWQLIAERIELLLTNGGGGLLLVVAILFLFLNSRVAFWVAVGVPVSFMAALAVLYFAGGSINMISLFAMIMTLGIIVDDAIVVGEDALTKFQAGAAPLPAAAGGARHMLAPVLAASLTTIAAFLPMMLIGGAMGSMLFDIPLVVVAVLIASLLECFFVLPGHLRGSFEGLRTRPPSPFRQRLEHGFARLRDHHFRRLLTAALHYRGVTYSVTAALFIIAAGLVAGGRINFTFFPSVEGTILYANASFVAGTPSQTVRDFLRHLEATLHETDAELGGKLVVAAVASHGASIFAGGSQEQGGTEYGSLIVELISPDQRTIRNTQFLAEWQRRVVVPPGIEHFTLFERMSGHMGRDIDIRLTGPSAPALKGAALELAEALRELPGVSAIEDDLPYGRDQLVYHLTPLGRSLGLDVGTVGRQLRAAFDGRLVQVYQEGEDEIEVRVVLPDAERHRLATLNRLALTLPNGAQAPLADVVEFSHNAGFEVLRHSEGQLAVHVSAFVDSQINNANRILAGLEAQVLPDLRARYGIESSLEGQAAEQRETMGDMARGAIFALAMIYLILAWVFASYSLPLLVMTAIPLGLVSAVLGHGMLGIELTILSLFGLLGLSGIVVNDSIILVRFYQELCAGGMAAHEAIIEAGCQRLRAVLLTSLTTIGGLLPLLFETSLQAQFLIPMAAAICFGLAFSTILVLVFVPLLLSIREQFYARRYTKEAAAAAVD